MTKHTTKLKRKMTELEPHKSVTWNVLIYESGDNTLYNMIVVRYISNELK